MGAGYEGAKGGLGVWELMGGGVSGVFVMASDCCIFSASRRLIVSHHGTESRG